MAETTTTTTEKTEEKKKPTVQEQFKTYSDTNQAGINKIYDTGLNAQKQGLLDAYNANTGAQDKQRQAIQQNYGAASQAVNTQNAISDRNLTQYAAARGVNTAAGSQLRLNLGNAAARTNAALDFQRQQALAEADRQKQLMTTTYQNQVQAAIANNDYKRAAALLDDYNNNQKWQEQQAQILASYGNFTPYEDLYGKDAATGMQKVWQAQNPDVAYRTGAITANQYHDITGNWPKGYSPGGGGYGGGYGGYLGDGSLVPTGNKVDYVTPAQNARAAAINAARSYNAAGSGGGGGAKLPSFNSVWGGGAF